ncbi:MFS transporter [Serratia sp. M24T3]|uniref:MFS transporter n=1 Tax=Serratia sp. M24T3 TaxID=932213 RepID=UPI00025BA7D0|nr:MFS transporter [Serratia sp. M24T3]EIC82636.1 major facilitator superfamily transporter [Serratia sp. M24T3]
MSQSLPAESPINSAKLGVPGYSPARLLKSAWLVVAVFMLSNAPTPLYIHWKQQFGFSSGTLTLIFACYILALVFTLLVAGQLADRLGRKKVIIPGLIASVLACLCFIGAQSIYALLAARFLTGIAVGVTVTASMAAVVDAGGESRKRQAALVASIAMVGGAGLGPVMSGAIVRFLPHPVFTVFAVELLVQLSAIIIALRLPPVQRIGVSASRPLRLPSIPKKNIFHLLMGCLFFAPGLTATSLMLSLGPVLLSHYSNAGSPVIAGIMACVMFTVAVGTQILCRKLPISKVFYISGTALIVAMLSIIATLHGGGVKMIFIAALASGAAQGLGQLGGLTLLSMNIAADRRAEGNALLNIGAYIPAGLLPVATGYLMDITGMTLSFTLLASTLVTVAVIGLTIATRQRNLG